MKSTQSKTVSATGVRASNPSLTSCSHSILKAYKFRLYPNKSQSELLARHFGCCRFVYNHFLEERKRAYEADKTTLNYYANAHSLTLLKNTDEFGWLGEVYGHSLQYSLRCLDGAYKRFFKKTGGFPRFHDKNGRQSCTFPDNAKIVDGGLKLPKFKTAISMAMHRPVDGRIHSVTVSMTPQGKYYAAILAEAEQEILPPTDNAVGIDLGIKDMAVCSNGERVANPKFLERSERHLRHLQRQVSRKTKGSGSRRRAIMELSRFHERIANRRNDYIHKFTTRIVRENQAVCVEDLNVKGMESNHHLAKSI